MSHLSSEKFTILLLFSKSSSSVFEAIRLLDWTEIITLNRVDVAYRHVTIE